MTVTLSSSASYTAGSPSTATVTIADDDAALPASIALSFNGQIRDRVGGGETALSADGAMDGTFTVTLNPSSGNRTVTRLDLARAGGGNWDTQPNNGFWVVGAASTLDAALLNAANGTVNFPLTAGSSFNIFASNFEGGMFVTGSSFTLTVSFADGSTATASVSIGAPALPTVTVAATDANAAEAGLDPGVFTVTRTGATTAALTVNYTVGGTATAGTDYQALSGSVVIAAGSASATITVTPIQDTVVEGNETVTVTLSSSASYTAGSPSTATVTIADDDVALPTVTVAATDANAAEAGLDPGVFTVTRTGATTAALTVNYTVGGTATAGTDYQALSGSVVIAAGSASATITVTPIQDTVVEGNETVTVTLSSSASYTAGSPSTATVTIADDDVALPTVTVAATDANAAEAGLDPGVFTVTRTGATTAALTVNYTVGGTATAGTDYQALSGSVVIAAGSASATITVTPIQDTVVEGNETVTVTLSSSASYTAGSPSTATVTIADDDAALPTVTTLSPNSATAGGPAFTLTVNGSNFVSGSVVQWNGAARTTTFVGATQLTAAIPASDIAAAGTAQVRVVNPGGGTSNALTFTITSPGFTLTVSRSGNGTVTSTPTGINCGNTCAAAYSPGTVVTLTATPQNKNFPFLGWSGGGCSGTGQCTLTMDANKQVTATFGKN